MDENFKEKLQKHPEILEFFRLRGFTVEDIVQASSNLTNSINELAISITRLAEIARNIKSPFCKVDTTNKNIVNPFERKYRNKRNRR